MVDGDQSPFSLPRCARRPLFFVCTALWLIAGFLLNLPNEAHAQRGGVVGPGLTVTTTTPPPAFLNEDYQYTLAATGGTPPYTWSIATTGLPPQFAASLPDGLSLNQTSGVLSGQPIEPGIRAIYIEVTDANDKKDRSPLALGVFGSAVHVSQLAGSDVTGTGSPDAPFASIGWALTQVAGTPAAPVAMLTEQGSYSGAVSLMPNVGLYGGYQAGSAFQARDASQYETRLDGAGTSATLTLADATLVDGCSVTGGNEVGVASGTLTQTLVANCRVFGNGGYDSRGAGIALTSASPVVMNSRIHGNRASYYHGATYGGGVRIATSAALVRNLIYANTIDAGGPGVTGNGAGLAIRGASGGVYVVDNVIAGNLLGANQSPTGAGIYCTVPDSVLERNLLVGNRNLNDGHGGARGGAVYAAASNVTVRNNVVFGNDGYLQGGGVYAATSVALLNNTFAFNAASTGGGINWAGGTGATTRNNLFFHNAGFAIAEAASGSMVLENNDFFGHASGLYLDDGVTALTDVAQVNALSGAQNNLAVDPLFAALASAQRDTNAYDAATGTSTFAVTGATFTPHRWTGAMLRFNVAQTAWFFILDNDTDTITVAGDVDSLVFFGTPVVVSAPGDTFEVYDYHLPFNAPVVDQGTPDATVTQDMDLDSRLTDAAGDIGADEVLRCCDAKCLYEGAGSPCGDGSNTDCTLADTCDSAGNCLSNHVPVATPCTDDGLFCTGVETCDGAGQCGSAGDPCSGSECNTCQEDLDGCHDPAGTQCTDDGNGCKDDLCDGAGSCAHPNNSEPCNDGNACTTADTCSEGACVGGPALDCDDGNPCTDDSCDTVDGCVHTDNTASCDDDDACNGHEVCSGRVCQAGTPLVCDDGNLCTQDSCDAAAGCVNARAPLFEASCAVALTSRLLVKNNGTDSKDVLGWSWLRGDEVLQLDLGEPDATTSYALCVYDHIATEPSLAVSLLLEPGPLWRNADPAGFGYRDTAASQDGVSKISIRTGRAGRSRVVLTATGAALPLPAPFDGTTFFDEDPTVIVQFVNSVGMCWTSTFTPGDTMFNRLVLFRAKSR